MITCKEDCLSNHIALEDLEKVINGLHYKLTFSQIRIRLDIPLEFTEFDFIKFFEKHKKDLNIKAYAVYDISVFNGTDFTILGYYKEFKQIPMYRYKDSREGETFLITEGMAHITFKRLKINIEKRVD